MKKEIFTIAGGNPTLLVYGAKDKQRDKVIGKYLGQVEQVGFVSMEDGSPRLTMMGGELCINATLALAYRLAGRGHLFTSGVEESIIYDNQESYTSISMDMKYHVEDNVVIFDGIGYMCTENEKQVSKEEVSSLAKKYMLPAFGVILYRANRIYPTVYVEKTRSWCRETACGSGSIAASIITGFTEIVQPTGEVISVMKNGHRISVAARVRRIASPGRASSGASFVESAHGRAIERTPFAPV